MKILYVTSEAAPFCKTGGLADVAGSLPPALAAQGESEISCVQYIERGYEDIVTKLQGLGASIRAVEVPGESEELEAHIG